MPNGYEELPYTSRSLKDVMLSAGDPYAWQRLGRETAGAVAESVPTSSYQKFNLALMSLLKQYQGLGTAKFTEAELTGREEAARRAMAPPSPELVGAAPSILSRVRAAQVGAMEPTITGAQQMGRTFAEQITGLGEAITAARTFATSMAAEEEAQITRANEQLKTYYSLYGKDFLTSLTPTERKDWERRTGMPKGTLDKLIEMPEPTAIEWSEPYTLSSGATAQKNIKTGAIKILEKPAVSAFKYTPTFAKGIDATQDAKSKLNDLKSVINYLETKQVKTGFIAGRKLEAGQKYGVPKLTPSELDFMSKFGKVRTGELFGVGGKVLAKQEIEELNRYIPTLYKSNDAVIVDLKNMYNRLYNIYNREISKLKLQAQSEGSLESALSEYFTPPEAEVEQ